MSHRENESYAAMLLLVVLLFLILISSAGVFMWLKQLRAMDAREHADRMERRAKEAAILMESQEASPE